MSTRQHIADILRGRILRGLNADSVHPGDRLPSSRELRDEFGADHRIILDAYRELAAEGLVELRPRGGIYVAARPASGGGLLPSASWVTDVLSQALAREIPIRELHDWIRRAAGTLQIRAVAVQCNADQIEGLARELRDDYGLDVTGLNVNALAARVVPAELRHADLVVTTPGCEPPVRALADTLRKPVIVVEIRPDLIGGAWRLLLRKTVYVVVGDEGFVPVLRRFFANTPNADNLRVLVAGVDSLDGIPEAASVYVTRSARDKLGDEPLRGQLVPAARLFSAESSREIIRFIVDANLRALATGVMRS